LARIPYADLTRSSDEVRSLAEQVKQERNGRLLNLFKMMLHSPAVTAGYLRLGTAVRYQASLDGRSRELAICKVAQLTGSQYEWQQHAPLARREGVSEAQLASFDSWRDSGKFNPREQAILAYAEEMTDRIKVADATFNTLHEHFDDQEIVELTMTIAFYNQVARFLVALQIDLEES
jgi:alkylhydroperoxidase family enzyme